MFIYRKDIQFIEKIKQNINKQKKGSRSPKLNNLREHKSGLFSRANCVNHVLALSVYHVTLYNDPAPTGTAFEKEQQGTK